MIPRPGNGTAAARLRAASLVFLPRTLSLGEGLRAAAAVATVVAAASAFHVPILSWAAIGALWTCLADPGGLGRERLRVMGGFTVLSTLFSLCAAGAAALGWGWAAVVVLPCAFVGAFLRVYGGAAAQAGALAVVAYVVAVDWPARSLAGLAALAAVYAGGCLWALVLSLSIWRIHPHRAARRALRATFCSLGEMAAGLAKLDARSAPEVWAQFAQRHRSVVRTSIETSRSVVGRVTIERPTTSSGDRLIVAVEIADGIFAELIALSQRLEWKAGHEAERSELERGGLRALAVILADYALGLERNAVPAEALREAGAELVRTASHMHGPEAPRLRAIGEQIEALADPGLVRSDAPASGRVRARTPFAPLAANLTWRSADLRHAVRCAVTIAPVVIVTHAMQLPYAYWAAMATVLVQQPSIATTWVRALERVAGSALGGVLAALLGVELHSTLALTVAVFPLAALTMAVRSINYSLFVLFLTPLFVLVVDLTQAGADELHLAAVRAGNNAAGALVALLGSLVLWPSREPDRLRVLLAAAVEANVRFATIAFSTSRDGRALDEARRAAGLASSNAEAARERSALEAWWRREMLQGALAVLVLVRGLAGIATAAALDRGTGNGDAQFADWLRDAAAALAARVRDGEGERLAPAPPAQDEYAARCVQHMALLETAVERFGASSAPAPHCPARRA